MDEARELGIDSYKAPNLLSVSRDLGTALQLNRQEGDTRPVFRKVGGGRIVDFGLIYESSDPEYGVIDRFFDNQDSRVFWEEEREEEIPANLHPNEIRGLESVPVPVRMRRLNGLLNLPNTLEDVRRRQEAVRELVENNSLYRALESILSLPGYQPILGNYRVIGANRKREGHLNGFYEAEEITGILSPLIDLRKFNPQSTALKELVSWAEALREDSLIQDLFTERRRITDSRLFYVVSERHKGARYGILKPGIKPEDVFDFLAQELAEDVVAKRSKGKVRFEARSIIKVKDRVDEEAIRRIVGHARQRMDLLNGASSRITTLPIALAILQAKQIYQGAYLHHYLQGRGFPACFPDIVEDPGCLEVSNLYPIRLVLEGSSKREDLADNSFSFSQEDRVMHVEGPNRRGKSEAWRSLHLLSPLVNMGGPVPATSARTGIIPMSYFISCKGDSGQGGSELERSLKNVMARIRQVKNGTRVILDEFGDSTNSPTSLAAARRAMPGLLRRGCQVFLTSHHPALSNYLRSEFGAKVFMPDPEGGKVSQYRLVPSKGEIDFKPEEVLDTIGFTTEALEKPLPLHPNPQPSRSAAGITMEEEMYENERLEEEMRESMERF